MTTTRIGLAALALALSFAAACTDDGGDKEIQVENRADVTFRVVVGETDFGSVAAATTTAARDVDNGPLALSIDGAEVDTLELGSDNVSGLWTLTVDRFETPTGTFQLVWGVTADF